MTPNALARRLDLFEIRPQVIRLGNQTPRGYERSQFDDAIERYQINLDDAVTTIPRSIATAATSPTAARHVSEFMTVLPVSEAIFHTAERLTREEARAQADAVETEVRLSPPPRRSAESV